MQLDADVPATLRLTVSVAASVTQITIKEDAPMVDAQSGTVRQVVGEEYIQDLPLNGRNAAALVYMAPGTVIGKGTDTATYATTDDTLAVSANGTMGNQVAYKLDGASHQDNITNLNAAFPKTDWNKRCRGVGATLVRPACSATEENLLQLDEDRYRGESILIHEFGHTMLVMGLDGIEPKFRADVNAAYKDAMSKGLFKNTYAATNVDEYWAEGVQDWFDANLKAKPANGIHNEIGTRADLKKYDPALAALLENVYGNDEWRWKAPKKKK
jgi:hypothetical protein